MLFSLKTNTNNCYWLKTILIQSSEKDLENEAIKFEI